MNELIYNKISTLVDNLTSKYDNNDNNTFNNLSTHPVNNYEIERFWNPVLYESYIAKMLLPSIFKYGDSINLNPRFAITSYLFLVKKKKI